MPALLFPNGGVELYDVLVIGGGPAGSHTAFALARRGYKVVVLERNKHLGEKVSCTGIISKECVDSFAIGEDVILRKVNSASLFSPSGKVLRVWRAETQACILDRTAFDIAMAQRAKQEGAEYIPDSPVVDIEVGNNGVRAKTSSGGHEAIFEAKAGVIASGFGSGLSERLGMGSTADFVTGAQTEVETFGIDEVEVYFGSEVAPGFFGWLVPTSVGMARVGLLSRRNPDFYLKKLVASLAAQGKITPGAFKVNYGAIPLKPLARTCGERVLVVGDAAGQVKPTSGGGIYYGLLCADIAADTLHQALQEGDLSAKSLSRYEQRWGEKLKRELKIGRWARKLFERLSDGQFDRIFDIIKDNGIDKDLLQTGDITYDWHGKAVLRLMGYKMLLKTMNVVRMPFKASDN